MTWRPSDRVTSKSDVSAPVATFRTRSSVPSANATRSPLGDHATSQNSSGPPGSWVLGPSALLHDERSVVDVGEA